MLPNESKIVNIETRAVRARNATKQTSVKRFALVLSLLLACAAPPLAATGPAVILATTTSTQDTGLLDVLVPAFQRASGYAVKTVAVGTGAALAMGERGDADVLLVHAPKAEEQYMAGGRGLERDPVMHNSFILVGPASDPAGTKGAPTPIEAFKRIAAAAAPFVSRADDSGTNKKELELWQAAGVVPQGAWYIKSGSGMADTLHIASEKGAYVLSDDGTYLSQRSTLQLVPEVEDAKDLRNLYHVIVVKPLAGRVGNLAGALAFAKYLVSPEGRQLIAAFGKERFGRPLFTVDAAPEPAGTP
jgi:tungstate transport system substrate-binding protein